MHQFKFKSNLTTTGSQQERGLTSVRGIMHEVMVMFRESHLYEVM